MWRTAGGSKETSIPDARPRTANHLARRNHPSAQHSTHGAKRHSYNLTAQFLTARDLVFHPFMDLYIFHREPVGLLGVFLDLFFFSLQPSIGGIWVYFWDLYLFRVWWCWIWHIPIWVFWVWFWTCTFLPDILVSFKDSVVFLCKPVGVVRFFWTCNFSRDLAPGSCVFSELRCVSLDIYLYLLYLFPLYFTHLFIPYPLSTCPCILQLLVTVWSVVWTLVRWILNPTL